MSEFPAKPDRIFEIAGAICDGVASPEDIALVNALVLADPDVSRRYLSYCRMHGALRLEMRAQRIAQDAYRQQNAGPAVLGNFDACDTTIAMPSLAPVVPHVPVSGWGSYVSSGWPVAYLMAAIIVGIGLTIAAVTHVSQPDEQRVVRQSDTLPAHNSPTSSVVGRITGMAECRWSESKSASHQSPVPNQLVSIGDRFDIQSGLLEITYDTGAKVILQGPVAYEVESTTGGYLAIGRLTARLEKGNQKLPSPACGRGAGGEGGLNQSDGLHSAVPLFAVRTPTAIVTDLGTEFGVQVDGSGRTDTRVFAGRVRVEDRKTIGKVSGRVLLAGEALRVDPRAGVIAIPKQVEPGFTRNMPSPIAAAEFDPIDKVDYSDTWTANSPTRAGSYLFLEDPLSQQVEQCYGNPLRSWIFGNQCSMTTWPRSEKKDLWPGFQVQGSKSGIMECGGNCYLGFQYGLRDDFVVQFDTVQVADRVNITVGDRPTSMDGSSQSLSVFFRQSNSSPNASRPEISVYHLKSETGEIDTGLRSGIPKAHEWHNYAVRFNLPAKQITVWVDRQRRGAVDFGKIRNKDGMPALAKLPISNQCITVGGYSGKQDDPVWVDNFRVGSPLESR